MRPFLDMAYPYRAPPGMPLLPPVVTPSIRVRRLPRRDNADVAWGNHALRAAARAARRASIVMLAAVAGIAAVQFWIAGERAAAAADRQVIGRAL